MSKPKSVALLSPGDMGHVVAQRLQENGVRTIAYLGDRSPRTRALAAQANIEEVDSYEALVTEADMILSILVPARAVEAAGKVAAALQATGATVLYADCNAIAPGTVRQVEQLIVAAGGDFVDASIVGGPPRPGSKTRFYTSGEHAGRFAHLGECGLNVVVLGDEVGQASAIKMCYASMTKGTTALWTNLLLAAERLNVREALMEEFAYSQSERRERMEFVPRVSMKSRRFVGEMEEIATTFEDAGVTPFMFKGAAEMYRLIGSTPLADRNPEDPEPFPTLDEMLAVLAAAVD